MKSKHFSVGCWIAVCVAVFGCAPKNEKQVKESERIGFTLQRTLPHDTKSFTQGLLIHQGQLYESTGQEQSWIGVVDIQTGAPEKKVVLDDMYFGEGITILNNKVYQLTWKNKAGFIYSFPSFQKIGEFTYPGEGWGLTTDGRYLIMSNGTDQLSFIDSVTMKSVRSVSVVFDGQPVGKLNELEYANGFVYANVWQTDLIAKIDPRTGIVQGFLDLSTLAQQARSLNPQADVMNGIAWHSTTKTMLVTGKYWPFIFILKLKDSKPGT